MKEHWELVHKDTGRTMPYKPEEFKELEQFCKTMIGDGTDVLYQIEYHPANGEVETNEITDYFYRLGESPEELKVDN
jgi:hypothetical protein